MESIFFMLFEIATPTTTVTVVSGEPGTAKSMRFKRLMQSLSPGIIVQGRHDICTPPVSAWELRKAWPEADLRIVHDAGHSASEPGIIDGLVRATDEFAGKSA